MKKYVIYAGVNGAGKSTFYNTRAEYDMPRVNSDTKRYTHEEVFSRLKDKDRD